MLTATFCKWFWRGFWVPKHRALQGMTGALGPWRNCLLLKKLLLKKAAQHLPGRHRHTVDGNLR